MGDFFIEFRIDVYNFFYFGGICFVLEIFGVIVYGGVFIVMVIYGGDFIVGI